MDVGLGIRPELFEQVTDQQPRLGLLEAHSENYFGESIALAKLSNLRENYPISLHGVGLSLGRADDLNQQHLKQLKKLVERIEPVLVSEHLAWSAYSHRHLPDLLPLPLNAQSLETMCQHVEQMQDALQRQILVENPSNYLLFDQLQIPEPEFLNQLAQRTGCGLLVDVNNIYVSASNLNRDAADYLAKLDSQYIGEYHLAGHMQDKHDGETLLIDTHNQLISPPVWQLFEQTIERHGARPTIVEWDSDFPELDVLLGQCEKADAIVKGSAVKSTVVKSTVVKSTVVKSSAAKSNNIKQYKESTHSEDNNLQKNNTTSELAVIEQAFLDEILNQNKITQFAIQSHQSRIGVYQNNVYIAIHEYLEEVYPAVKGVVGDAFFKKMATHFTRQNPPSEGDINGYGDGFSAVLNQFSALSDLVYLSDLMEYEWALHRTYFSVIDKPVIASEHEQAVLLSMPIKLNASTRLVQSNYPIYQIHRQSLPDFTEPVQINLSDSQDALLVYKNGNRVDVRLLNHDERLFFAQLQQSQNLLQVIEALNGLIKPESLTTLLAFVFEVQLLSLA